MQEIRDLLRKMSLSDKEIEVYLAILKHGPMFATDIAKETGINRQNVYDILKKLQEKGFAYQLGSLYGKKFKITPPKELLKIIERRKIEQEEVGHELTKVLPLMASMIQNEPYEPYPKIEFFEGIEEIKNLVVKSLQCKEKIIKTMTSIKSWTELLGKEFTNYYIKRRVDQGIKSYTLRLKSGEIKDPFYQQHQKQKREVRYAPKNIKLDASVMLFDDKIIFLTTKKEKLGLLLQSKDYSKTINSWFDFIWQHSKST